MTKQQSKSASRGKRVRANSSTLTRSTTGKKLVAPSKSSANDAYIKSANIKQAFFNLGKLNFGAAWHAVHLPVIVLMLAFGLVAISVADSFPVVDLFNSGINEVFQSFRGAPDKFIVTLTTFGDIFPLFCLCAVICIFLDLCDKWDSLVFFALNVIGAVVVTQALKLIFAVPRPSGTTLVDLPFTYSFPSAHSLCALVVYGMLGLLIYRALARKGVPSDKALIPGVVLVVFALCIGLSRIYVGVHWPSDVLGGWLLGGAWLFSAGALYTKGSRLNSRK